MLSTPIIEFDDRYYMGQALLEASKAYDLGEMPIGSVVVGADGRILGRGHNLTERLRDVTAHAEMQAISAACQTLDSKYLQNCSLYVTLEPCVMCAGAIGWVQIKKVVFGASDAQKGFRVVTQKSILHPKCVVVPNILENECSALLKAFFEEKRKTKKMR